MDFDVIICGGGTAGAPAAIASGRQGARTLVIDQLGSLGGTQANGWVTPMMPNYLEAEKLSRGLSEEISFRQARFQTPGDRQHSEDWYDPTYLALVLDEMASEANVTPLFDTVLSDVEVQNGRIAALELISRGRKLRVSAKMFVDCTGDAALSKLAGAEVMEGNENGVHQPMTLRFSMGNIDLNELAAGRPDILRINTGGYLECGYGEAKEGHLAPQIEDAIRRGVLEKDDLGYFQFFSVNGRPNELAFNAPRISGLDPLDPFEYSRAYQVGRAKIYRIARFVREYLPGFKNAYVSAIAPLMGIRESRRVVGEYVLTAEDHQQCRKFSNSIAQNRYPVDIHLTTGIDYRRFPPGEWHDIPYECLVVKNFDNLFVAGRCASADFVAQSSIRIQPVCRAMGEAAGTSAALCAAKEIKAKELPYSDLAPHLVLRPYPSGSAK